MVIRTESYNTAKLTFADSAVNNITQSRRFLDGSLKSMFYILSNVIRFTASPAVRRDALVLYYEDESFYCDNAITTGWYVYQLTRWYILADTMVYILAKEMVYTYIS